MHIRLRPDSFFTRPVTTGSCKFDQCCACRGAALIMDTRDAYANIIPALRALNVLSRCPDDFAAQPPGGLVLKKAA